jgi:AraC family transcriptional regulator of adaptative response / DNA-3-methyladenine glycosylase II
VVEGREYRRTISLEGRSGSITVTPDASKNYLNLQIRYPNPAALFRIVERVRRIFDVGADPDAISKRLQSDARLKPVLRAHPGLRVPGCWDGFEMSVRAILGQQVSVKAASTMAGRVADAFGERTADGIVFPSAVRLADADLSLIGVTKQRAASIRDLAHAVADGEIKFDGALDVEQFEERITQISGIGPWTAQYIAMRLGEPDAYPASDLYLKKCGGEPESWRPWRAYAAMYIWKGHVNAEL